MPDDGKRTENVCAKVTERMALDLLHEASRQEVSVSNWLFRLIRRELYGTTGADRNLRSEPISDDR